jgi:hypothetical protein
MTTLQIIVRRFTGTYFLCVLFVFAAIQHDLRAIDYDAFAALPQSEQHALIAESFMAWLDATKNMRYTCTETVEFPSKNREPREPQQGSRHTKDICNHWLRDDAFRYEKKEFWAPSRGRDSEFVRHWQWTFNKQREEARSLVTEDMTGTPTFHALIDSAPVPKYMTDTFVDWLSDRLHNRAYLFPFTLKHLENWEIALLPEEQQVKLIIPYEFESSCCGVTTRSEGRKELILDPQKNFLPILIDSHWEELPKTSDSRYKTDRYIVEESAQFGSIWMPTVLIYELLDSHLRRDEDYINIHTVRITDVEFGTVTESDVEFVFPAGIEVADCIKYITYTTDAHGNPIPSTVRPFPDLESQSKSKILSVLALTVIGALLIAFVVWGIYRKREAETKDK